jgi:hypothetical protein
MKIFLDAVEEVSLDPEVLSFSEATLNQFLTRDAAVYSYYSSKLVDAQYLADKYDEQADIVYSKKFQEFKDEGGTDKLADAKAKACYDVVEAKEKARLAKRNKDFIWNFLKALDKAHENALNLGYNIRREQQLFQHQQIKSLEEIVN